MEEKRKQIIEITRKLLDEKGLDSGSDPHGIEVLAGDGSQRQFYRLQFDNGLSMVAILPSADQKQGMEEAYSSWSIGNHLYSKGIPVPELISFDSQTGLILTEDLGDVRLDGRVLQLHGQPHAYPVGDDAPVRLGVPARGDGIHCDCCTIAG